MVKYHCKTCNYNTKNKSDYQKHCKTQKHISKEIISRSGPQQIHNIPTTSTASDRDDFADPKGRTTICPFCGDLYSRRDSLKRHQATCSRKFVFDEQKKFKLELKKKDGEIEKRDEKLKQKNKEIRRKNKELAKYEDELHYFRQILQMTEGKNSSNVSMFNYINKNYTKAEPLKGLTYEEFAEVNQIQYIDNDMSYEDKLAQDLIYSHRHKILGKYIGNVLVSLYKKEDPMEQSLWTTDSTRLKYIVRRDYKKTSRWMTDLNGEYINAQLIEPVTFRMKDILHNYRDRWCCSDTKLSFDDYGNKMKESLAVLEIARNIDNKKVSKEVLKYIAMHFNLNKMKIKNDKSGGRSIKNINSKSHKDLV